MVVFGGSLSNTIMHKIRTHGIFFALTIIFILIVLTVILYPFDFASKDINQVYIDNSGLFWLLGIVIGIVIMGFQYFIFLVLALVKKLSKDNEEKNTEILKNQKDSFTQFEELNESITDLDKFYFEKWIKVTTDISSINKRLDIHSEKIAKLEG